MDLARLAANLGYARGQNILGAMYASGELLTRDADEAVRLFRLSAEQGYDWSQLKLGESGLHPAHSSDKISGGQNP